MDDTRNTQAAVQPHFIETPRGQLRVWQVGQGPAVVVLPGLLKGPVQRARECAVMFPGCTILAFELPGIGASFTLPSHLLRESISAICDGLDSLNQSVALVAFDLAGPLAEAVAQRSSKVTVAVWLERARFDHASRNANALQGFGLQWDGCHLVRLWNHLRDHDRLDLRHPLRVRMDAAPYMTAEELDEAVLCFGENPQAYEDMWNFLAGEPVTSHRLVECATPLEAVSVVHAALDGHAYFQPAPSPSFSLGISRRYVDVSRGRVHLRRAGQGPLLLAFLAGAGSSANLSSLLHGLSDRFTVVAPDYIGQGDGCRAEEPTDVAQLAVDAREIADALGFERFHVYGTHTGAGVAIELGIAAADRIDGVVIDGISMTPPADRAEHRENYFPLVEPDIWGLHLLKVWNVRRDGGYFWPWFKPVPAYARKGEAPSLPLLHDRVMSTLRSRSTPAYQAITLYDAAARLAQLERPALYVAGPNDTFATHMDRARSVARGNVRFLNVPATVWMTGEAPERIQQTLHIFAEFFESVAPLR